MIGQDDLKQLAHLLRVSADTARLIADHARHADVQKISDAAQKIDDLADELDAHHAASLRKSHTSN